MMVVQAGAGRQHGVFVIERLLDIEVPERAKVIRVLMTELNRISSHLVALATNGMDIGALSMMIYGFRDREMILNFFEKTSGLRMNNNYIRPGGVAVDLPDGWEEDVAEILDVPVGTVRTRMFHARKKLQAKLGAMGIAGG